MAEQETKTIVKETIWTPVENKPGLEAASVGAIRMNPDVEPEVAKRYKEEMENFRAGKYDYDERGKGVLRFTIGEYDYGLTHFRDNDSMSIWRRKKGTGGSGGAKKPYLRLTGFTVGDENKLNAFLIEHPNGDYFLEPITFPDVSTGIQQFVISSKKLVWPKEETSQKPEETKTA